MASREPTAFQRVFPASTFRHGGTFKACVWSALASLLLCLLLFDGYLAVGMLSQGGRLQISQTDLQELIALVGEDSLTASGYQGDRGDMVTFEDSGLIGEVWRDRKRPWAPALGALYGRLPSLRNDTQALVTLVSFGAFLAFLRYLALARARTSLLRVALDVATRLRHSVHRQTMRLGPSDLEGVQSAQALELFTTEVDQMREGIYRWADCWSQAPFQLALLFLFALSIQPMLALVCVMPLTACWYIAQQRKKISEEKLHLSEANSRKQLRLLAESLAKTRLVRGFGMEAFELEQFQKYLKRFQDNTAVELTARGGSHWIIQALAIASISFALFFVGIKVLRTPLDVSFASGLLLLSAIFCAYFPLQRLAHVYDGHDLAEKSAGRIQAYLNRIPEVGQAVGAKFLHPLSRMLEFDSVSYQTPTRRTLVEHLSLKIAAGKQVAFVSTDPLEALSLAYMLPRFIEPQSGRILIDGEDISWVTLESLRAETVFVGGKDPFLTGTVRDNICAGSSNTSLQEATDAAKLTHAHNFILKLPQGYETVIGEHGEQLDAGQSFRLGLTRAVLRKPALLIIEEPGEVFDEDTKSLIDDAYSRIVPDRTTIFLPTRLSTLRRVDEIVLVHKGRVEAIGNHARLVASSQLYRHWEYLKFNEFRHEFEMA